MNSKLKYALGIGALAIAAQATAQITFYESEGFRGRTFAASGEVSNFQSAGFNDRASSVVVERGRWEVCENARFRGRCVVLRQGSYDSLERMGMQDRISSVRRVAMRDHYDNASPEPLSAPNYEYRRRPNEQVYYAPVTSVHAVMGAPNQRCWVERQQVDGDGRSQHNVGGAIVGGLIGGILGHQVGGGTGNDIATAGGAVAGAVVGSRVGRNGSGTYEQDVRRCETTTSGTPAFWDVAYRFRNVDHQLQMNSAPGNTVAVNRNGEPRQ